MKIIEAGGKFWKKSSECKIVMMRFEKKLSIVGNGPFLPKLGLCDV